jgi:16S rRNA U516 pseudouridylate synthase RsuA-like enzyme
VALQRVAFGPLSLGDVKEGQARRLSKKEVASLRDAAAVGEEQTRPPH